MCLSPRSYQMSSQFQGRATRFDLIEDLVDSPSSAFPRKILSHRMHSNYSSLPNSLNKHEYPPSTNLRDRFHLTYSRSNSSSVMMNNDERRKELDLLIKHLYDGKLISTITDDHQHSSSINQSETKPLTRINHKKKNSNKNIK